MCAYWTECVSVAERVQELKEHVQAHTIVVDQENAAAAKITAEATKITAEADRVRAGNVAARDSAGSSRGE